MRGVEYLCPELQAIANEFVRRCKAKGLNVLITETYRSKAEQDALYAKGRTTSGKIVTNAKYPKSPHCWGVAFDFCRNVKGREYDDSDNFFKRCGAIGKELGLTWGGDWTGFVDKPHLELKKYMPNSSTNYLINKYGTPDNFKKTWVNMEENEVRYNTVNELPTWAKDAINAWMKKGLISGDGTGLDLSEDMVRMIVMLYRAGIGQ